MLALRRWHSTATTTPPRQRDTRRIKLGAVKQLAAVSSRLTDRSGGSDPLAKKQDAPPVSRGKSAKAMQLRLERQ